MACFAFPSLKSFTVAYLLQPACTARATLVRYRQPLRVRNQCITMKCPHCQAEVTESAAAVCPVCGKEIAPPLAAPPPAEAATAQKSSAGYWLVFFAVLLAPPLLTLGAASGGRNAEGAAIGIALLGGGLGGIISGGM